LRDDIRTLVSSLISLLSNKKNISIQFIDNYTAILFNIHSSDLESVHILLDKNLVLTEQIDLIDYDIFSVKQSISEKSGIPLESLHKYMSDQKSVECQKYSELIEDINNIYFKISLLIDKVTYLLENEMTSIRLSINDCAVLSKFRDVFYQRLT
jgi:hypothetical protein